MIKMVFGVLMSLLILPKLTFPLYSPRTVTTKFGSLRGILINPVESSSRTQVEVFYGIPYASPPLGSLRLMPPVSGAPWSGTKMNLHPSPVCPQLLPRYDNTSLNYMPKGELVRIRRLFKLLNNQSEDCLYINIYVPWTMKSQERYLPGEGVKYPVLVFVHGDDFGYGAGHPYNPSVLVGQQHVIVVTMNYRLGILGFLNANSNGHFKSPANFALLDQIAALHWVQENIHDFGGDSSNVTLMGQGKGAIFVNFLMISSAVPKGLFHRVILMSGSALSPLASGLSYGRELAKNFAKTVKCPTEPPPDMLQCLRQIPLQYFLNSQFWFSFGPSDDGVVIEEGIRENVLKDRLGQYDLMFGVTNAESLNQLSQHQVIYGIEDDTRREILRNFIDKYFSVHRNEILAAAIHEYTDWERPLQHPKNIRQQTIDAMSDAQVVAPLLKVGEWHSQSNSRSYFYVFEYQSKNSEFQERVGCPPGEDLKYIFGIPLYFYENGEYLQSLEHKRRKDTNTDIQYSKEQGDVTNLDETVQHQPNSFEYDFVIEQEHQHTHSKGRRIPSHILYDDDDIRTTHVEQQLSPTTQGSPDTTTTTDILATHFGFFTGNFTRNEVQLSLAVMSLWANFIRTGNPNDDDGSPLSQDRLSSANNNKNENSNSNKEKGRSGSRVPEWSAYEPIFKKYLSIDSRFRLRDHYRIHKLSFWLHLVPDLQKNSYGAPNSHHSSSANSYPLPENNNNVNGGSHVGGIGNRGGMFPNPNSGLIILPSDEKGGKSRNGSTPPPPTIQLVGPPLWEHRPNAHNGFFQDGDSDGFQMYSTALSVTIAIGCSLLILNILIFAAFYYQRDKRRAEEMENSTAEYNEDISSNTQTPQINQKTSTAPTTAMLIQSGNVESNKQDQQSNANNSKNSTPPNSQQHPHHLLHHHHQQQPQQQPALSLPQQQPPSLMMSANICNELPPPQLSDRRPSLSNSPFAFEMPMPDAILNASMVNFEGSPDCGSLKSIRMNSNSTKFQQQPMASYGIYDSRTCPRPPKRTTPSVKFGPETMFDASSSNNHYPLPSSIASSTTTQTLKPSLKKSFTISTPNSGGDPTNIDSELKV